LDTLYNIQSFGCLLLEILNKEIACHETEVLHSQISKARHYNHWFTEDSVTLRLRMICNFLISDQFKSAYSIFRTKEFKKKKTFGIFSEENIPLEEFPTLLSILVSGNSFIYKTTEKSDKLISFFFEFLQKTFKEFEPGINFTEGNLKDAEEFIITQQKDNKVEIKKYLENKISLYEVRNQSVAVLDGNESPAMLKLLASDIFNFFGMGSGSVRKLFVPLGYDLTILFKVIEKWHSLLDHSAYANNYQYYQSVFLINQIAHLDNGFLLLTEDSSYRSPTGVLYYEYYDNKSQLFKMLNNSSNISDIYTSGIINGHEKMFGESVNQMLLPSEKLIKFLQ
jgi:hypothetical protein